MDHYGSMFLEGGLLVLLSEATADSLDLRGWNCSSSFSVDDHPRKRWFASGHRSKGWTSRSKNLMTRGRSFQFTDLFPSCWMVVVWVIGPSNSQECQSHRVMVRRTFVEVESDEDSEWSVEKQRSERRHKTTTCLGWNIGWMCLVAVCFFSLLSLSLYNIYIYMCTYILFILIAVDLRVLCESTTKQQNAQTPINVGSQTVNGVPPPSPTTTEGK